jgi:hypothetical protein
MNNEIIYGFVNENNLLIGTAVIISGDITTLNRVKSEYNAFAYHIIDTEISHAVIVDYSVWHNDRFVEPQPFPSWIFDENLNYWIPPVFPPENAYDPENPVEYVWNEEILNWEQVSE